MAWLSPETEWPVGCEYECNPLLLVSAREGSRRHLHRGLFLCDIGAEPNLVRRVIASFRVIDNDAGWAVD